MVGATIWLTGLPSSGKSTLAQAAAAMFTADGYSTEILDGDDLRAHLSRDLGFSKEDRIENVRRIGFIARILARNGIVALVPVIAPYVAGRDHVRDMHSAEGVPFIEVYVATPLQVCLSRDVKGLYGRQARGEIHGVTGVDDPYEVPIAPDVEVDTSLLTVDESAAMIRHALKGIGRRG
jgi:adenylylsulfate kinase